MRPVLVGDRPVDDAGDEVTFTDYKQARDPLIDRIGDYCSYCGISLPSQIDVEHILPKNPNPALELEWTNFLLACTNCNSIKGHKDVVLADFYWPHLDNTFRAFVYEQDLPPQVVDSPEIDSDVAEATIRLTGLDRLPGHANYSDRDRRWLKRVDVWSVALQTADFLAVDDSDAMRTLAVEVARARGFWSVWMTVFFDDVDMCRRLINAFPGTAIDCFDDDTNPLPRLGGAV
jgi:hypothetical protein